MTAEGETGHFVTFIGGLQNGSHESISSISLEKEFVTQGATSTKRKNTLAAEELHNEHKREAFQHFGSQVSLKLKECTTS